MNRYYLDTNAVVDLREHLGDLRQLCYTSILTLLELLKNTSANNFEKKREFVVGLLDSKLPIDWATPVERVQLGFDVIKLRKHFRNLFMPTLEQLRNARTYDDFIQRSKQDSISFDDINVILRTYVETLKSTIESMQNSDEIPKLSRSEIRRLAIEQGYDESLKSLEQKNAEHIFEAVAVHAEMISEKLPKDVGDFTIPLLFLNYNRSLDRYFCAFSFYMRKRILLRESPHDNDLIDIQHFAYLQNRTCKIVTNDKMILETCNSLFPRSCMRITNFKSEFLR